MVETTSKSWRFAHCCGLINHLLAIDFGPSSPRDAEKLVLGPSDERKLGLSYW